MAQILKAHTGKYRRTQFFVFIIINSKGQRFSGQLTSSFSNIVESSPLYFPMVRKKSECDAWVGIQHSFKETVVRGQTFV